MRLVPLLKTTERLVSIHASVKDATIGYRFTHVYEVVSIHASVKDATWFSI